MMTLLRPFGGPDSGDSMMRCFGAVRALDSGEVVAKRLQRASREIVRQGLGKPPDDSNSKSVQFCDFERADPRRTWRLSSSRKQPESLKPKALQDSKLAEAS